MADLLGKLASNDNIFDRLTRVEDLLRELQTSNSIKPLTGEPTIEDNLFFLEGFLNVDRVRVTDYFQIDSQHSIQFLKSDLSGILFSISTTGADTLLFTDQGSKNGYEFLTTLTSGGTPSMVWKEDPATSDRAQLDLGLAVQGTKLTMGGEILISGEGASGGSNQLGIGTSSPSATAHIVGDMLVAKAGDVATFGDGSSSANIYVNGAAGSARHFVFQSGGSNRWFIRTNGTAEAGSNAGSDLEIVCRNDSGGNIAVAMSIERATGAVQVGSPTGGYKGAGTINAKAVYDDNTLLTDWLFDLFYDGKMRRADRERQPNGRIWTVGETAAFTKQNRHLPTMPGRDEWEASGSKSVGELVTALWETVEQQQLQIFELNRRLTRLEAA